MSTLKIAATFVALLTITLSSTSEAGVRDWMRRHAPRMPRMERPVHVHAFETRTERVWVRPVTKRVFVGHSRFGFPRYSTVVVQSGYYKNVVRRVCRSCGRHG